MRNLSFTVLSQVKLLEQHPALRKTKRSFKMGSSVSRSCWRAGAHGFCMSVRQYYLDRRRISTGAAPIALCVLPSCCAHRLEAASGREGGSRSLHAGLRRYFDATSSPVQGEPLHPHLPSHPAHVLTCSPLVCPCSQQAPDWREVNTKSTSSSASTASDSSRGRYRRATASRGAGGCGNPHVAGRCSRVWGECAGCGRAHRGAWPSPSEAAARRAAARSVASRCTDGGRGEHRWGSHVGPSA